MTYITIYQNGRLGNLLFQIISMWAYAKKYNIIPVLDISFINNKYYNIFFKSIQLIDLSTINFIKYECDLYSCIIDNIFNNNNILLIGYLQNAYNFDIYRNDILSTFFNNEESNENNNFFIHIRLCDFLTSSLHNIDLDNYYHTAIKYIINKYDVNLYNFFIISDDIHNAYKKIYLEILPNKIFIDNTIYNEINTLDIFKKCYMGGIIGNSTYAWWGAYIIKNPNKLIICPNKFVNKDYDFSGLCFNYHIIDI